MARPFTSLPAVNDLSLEGRVLRDTDWRWNNQVAYEVNDIVVFDSGSGGVVDDNVYVCIQAADGAAQSPTNVSYWRQLSNSGDGTIAFRHPDFTADESLSRIEYDADNQQFLFRADADNPVNVSGQAGLTVNPGNIVVNAGTATELAAGDAVSFTVTGSTTPIAFSGTLVDDQGSRTIAEADLTFTQGTFAELLAHHTDAIVTIATFTATITPNTPRDFAVEVGRRVVANGTRRAADPPLEALQVGTINYRVFRALDQTVRSVDTTNGLTLDSNGRLGIASTGLNDDHVQAGRLVDNELQLFYANSIAGVPDVTIDLSALSDDSTHVQSGRIVDNTLELFYGTDNSGNVAPDVEINVSSLLSDTRIQRMVLNGTILESYYGTDTSGDPDVRVDLANLMPTTTVSNAFDTTTRMLTTTVNGVTGAAVEIPGGSTQATTNTLDFNNTTRVLTSTVDGVEATATIPAASIEDELPPRERAVNLVQQGYIQNNPTRNAAGLVVSGNLTYSNNEVITYQIDRNTAGLANFEEYSGDLIEALAGDGMSLFHRFTRRPDGLTTNDRWEFGTFVGQPFTVRFDFASGTLDFDGQDSADLSLDERSGQLTGIDPNFNYDATTGELTHV